MRCQGPVANVARARTLKFQTNVSTTLYVRYRSVYVCVFLSSVFRTDHGVTRDRARKYQAEDRCGEVPQ